MEFVIRPAEPTELEAICELLPRLADFELPAGRVPRHLWQGDEKIIRSWAAGGEQGCLLNVAEAAAKKLLGVAMCRLRAELLSGEPSAHLEILMVTKDAEGHGIGKALIAATENSARAQGAKSMSLNAFRTNTRARRLYEQLGYDGELIRYIKQL